MSFQIKFDICWNHKILPYFKPAMDRKASVVLGLKSIRCFRFLYRWINFSLKLTINHKPASTPDALILPVHAKRLLAPMHAVSESRLHTLADQVNHQI